MPKRVKKKADEVLEKAEVRQTCENFARDLGVAVQGSLIERHYEWLLKKMGQGTLFGMPVDMSNPKAVAVAAYHIGWNEAIFGIPKEREG